MTSAWCRDTSPWGRRIWLRGERPIEVTPGFNTYSSPGRLSATTPRRGSDTAIVAPAAPDDGGRAAGSAAPGPPGRPEMTTVASFTAAAAAASGTVAGETWASGGASAFEACGSP